MATGVGRFDGPALGATRYPAWTRWQSRGRLFLILGIIAATAIFGSALLLALGPRLIGYSSFVVYGGSMEPAIRTGSIAVAKPVSVNSLAVGDVIAYKRGLDAKLPTIHRIVAIEEVDGIAVFTLKGDANDSADPAKVSLEGPGSKVLYSVPQIGRFAHFAGTPRGRFLLVFLPAAGLGILLLWEIWAPNPSQPERLRQ